MPSKGPVSSSSVILQPGRVQVLASWKSLSLEDPPSQGLGRESCHSLTTKDANVLATAVVGSTLSSFQRAVILLNGRRIHHGETVIQVGAGLILTMNNNFLFKKNMFYQGIRYFSTFPHCMVWSVTATVIHNTHPQTPTYTYTERQRHYSVRWTCTFSPLKGRKC